MSKFEDNHVKIEAGQILNPDNFPTPNELVCIEVAKVFDQVALRECQEAQVPLYSVITVSPLPVVTFDYATDFDITSVTVVQKTDAMSRARYKKVKLAVTIGFKVFYSINGVRQANPVNGSTTFPLIISEIYCPDCPTQMGIIRLPEDPNTTNDIDGTLIKVEALAEAFNDQIIATNVGNQTQFTLHIEIGAFFVAKCEGIVQLLIPAYGYCPVPPEQQQSASGTITCGIFNDKCRTPFPSQFYPDQKWNPLDKGKKEDWDD